MSIPHPLHLTPSYVGRLILRYGTYYMRHLQRPYRRDLVMSGSRNIRLSLALRQKQALRDAFFNIVLDAYTEQTNLKISSTTGAVFVLLMDLAQSFDAHFEKQVAVGGSLVRAELLNEPALAQKLGALREYLQFFGIVDPVLAQLRACFAAHYDTYIDLLDQAKGSLCFTDVLHTVELDSGELTGVLVEVVALFNGHVLPADTRHNFYLFGIAGKFADDLVDLARDVRNDRPNLLHTLLLENSREWQIWQQASRHKGRLNARWWNRYCPSTLHKYCVHMAEYYDHITSPKLRSACDLMLLPAVLGVEYDSA